MRSLVVLALAVDLTYASFCGSSAIPFSFEALPDGQPVLGCARPVCFGWNETGQPATEDGGFYRINKHPDGFMRRDELYVPPFSQKDPRFFQQNIAVARNGSQYAFDYISNIAKTIAHDGSVTYEVYMRRFVCLPPVESKKQHKVVSSPMVYNAQEFRRAPQHNRAFQVPNVPVNNPVQIPAAAPSPGNGIEGPFEENVVVEEQIAQEGVEIEPTTSTLAPEPLPPQPQPQQPLFPQQQFVPEPIYYPPVAQPAPAAPAYYSTSGGYYCFTGDTKARLIDGTDKRLDELEVDDWVQTLKGAEVQYAPVSFWLHRVPHQQAEFHKIELSDGTELKLTAKHFIYKTTCPTADEGELVDELSRQAVFADKVSEGDCLYKVTEDERVITARVTKVSKVTETGIYSPMTSNGKIIVNGIYASCHNIVESYSLQNTFFSYVDTLRKWYSSIFGAHMGVDELPLGIDTLTIMMDYVIPKNLVTM
ncbi:hypothetical protein Y032_0151g2819 [Ancylostoma ceylanicum]|uniref:Intein splicing region n=1 Tax=Ancylostoma ceylanicum TaxID=53326 RepID=A0A016T195_9BILA|nr:hypothetical protein Y032_0151g2819 [Ancylostoma ceylanicum]